MRGHHPGVTPPQPDDNAGALGQAPSDRQLAERQAAIARVIGPNAGRCPRLNSDDAAERYVARFVEAWAAPDNETIAQRHWRTFSQDAVLLQPLVAGVVGADEMKKSLGRLFEVIPDLRATVERWATNGSTVLMELTMQGTMGGRPLRWPLVDRMTLDGDLVIERVTYFDSLPLLLSSVARPRAWRKMMKARMYPRIRWQLPLLVPKVSRARTGSIGAEP